MIYDFGGLLLQVAGIMGFCFLGSRCSAWLMEKSQWLPLCVALVLLVPVSAFFLLLHLPHNFIEQTAAFWIAGFAGSIIATQRNEITGK